MVSGKNVLLLSWMKFRSERDFLKGLEISAGGTIKTETNYLAGNLQQFFLLVSCIYIFQSSLTIYNFVNQSCR